MSNDTDQWKILESLRIEKKIISQFFLFILLCISTNLCVCVQNIVNNCIELKFFLAHYIFCSEQSKSSFQHSIWLHLLKIQRRWGSLSINFIALDEIHHLEQRCHARNEWRSKTKSQVWRRSSSTTKYVDKEINE